MTKIHTQSYNKMILGTIKRSLTQMAKRSSASSISTPELGRWKSSYDAKSLEREVHLAKENHCGEFDVRETQRDIDVLSYIADCCGNGCSVCEVFAILKGK